MATSMETAAPEAGVYPIRLTIDRPDKQSRLTNFPLGIGTFIRYILLVPHLIILYFLGIVAGLVYLLATFAILFTARYPLGLYNLVVGYMRWSSNLSGYAQSLYDKYPPFSTDAQPGYPLSFTADYVDKSSRLLNFPFFGLLIKYVLLIPHVVVLAFLGIIAFVILFIAQFAILFTGSFPAGMHGYVVGVTRWNARLQAYGFGLTDKYPPFSLS